MPGNHRWAYAVGPAPASRNACWTPVAGSQIRTRPVIAYGGQYALPSHGHGAYTAEPLYWPQSRTVCWDPVAGSAAAEFPAVGSCEAGEEISDIGCESFSAAGGSWRSDSEARWTVSASKSPLASMLGPSPPAATSWPGERSGRVTVLPMGLWPRHRAGRHPAAPVRADGYLYWPGR